MIKYKENMVVDQSDIDYLNASVKEINEALGRDFIDIKSTPNEEDECADIFEDGVESYSCYSFDEVELYLNGIKQGLKIRKQDKITMELTDEEFDVISRLIGEADDCRKTKVGDRYAVALFISFSKDGADALKRLNTKINS